MGCTNNALAFFAISARNVAITKKNVFKVLFRVSIPNAHRFVMVSPRCCSVSQSLINAHRHFFCIL